MLLVPLLLLSCERVYDGVLLLFPALLSCERVRDGELSRRRVLRAEGGVETNERHVRLPTQLAARAERGGGALVAPNKAW